MKVQALKPKEEKRLLSTKGQWATIGWYGISFQVPPNWNLAVIGGDNKSGYLRVDDEEMPRVQVKWSETQKTVELRRILQNYIKGLKKGAKKKKVKLEFEEGVRILPKRRKRQKNLLGFTWRADCQAYGLVWYCRSCGRVVISQVTGRLDEQFANIASRVLESIEDHPQEGWNTWALYDFSIKVPEGFILEKHKLLTGLIDLSFAHRKQTLRVVRWGIANVILKEHSLAQWFKGKEGKALSKQFKYEVREGIVMRHQGLRVQGYKKRFMDQLRRLPERLLKLKPALWLNSSLWHCPESNKIFLVHMVANSPNNLFSDQVCSFIRCH